MKNKIRYVMANHFILRSSGTSLLMPIHMTRDAIIKIPAGKISRTDKSCVEIIKFPPLEESIFASNALQPESWIFNLDFSKTSAISVKAKGKRLKKKNKTNWKTFSIFWFWHHLTDRGIYNYRRNMPGEILSQQKREVGCCARTVISDILGRKMWRVLP